MIETPVRGKFCKHWEFFDLLRVYECYVSGESPSSFECFVCCQPVAYDEIIFLKEMDLILAYAKA